ncbi:MAG TPA: 8-oxo-dGTP diphosphatase [Trueperaceae bacterium]|nr:8-oxo-dGTP diphosphatase [Trueperaceae bacterium]
MIELPKKTLMLLIKDKRVLLAYKKRGVGKGKIVAVGGGVEDGETILQAAIRETIEEVTVVPNNPKEIAELKFNFPYKPEYSMHVFVFMTDSWQGTISETEELRPSWYSFDNLPYEQMWADAPYWLSRVLAGDCIRADFYYAKDLTIDEMNIDSL